FAFRNVCEIAELELAWIARSLAQRSEPAALRVLHCLLARDDDFLERMVRFDLLLHLLLDLRKIFGRDAVAEFHVVIKAVLDRRAGRELGVGPEAQYGGGEDVGA